MTEGPLSLSRRSSNQLIILKKCSRKVLEKRGAKGVGNVVLIPDP